jgi:hypothetical protein
MKAFEELKNLIKFEVHDKEEQLDFKLQQRVKKCKEDQGLKFCSECHDFCLIRRHEKL